MNLRVLALVTLVVPAMASAQVMNADRFYQRATALNNKGMMAVFSGGEIKALTSEVQAASKAASESRRAALKAGQKPRFCPPEGPQKLNSKELMTRLSAIPTEERARIDMTEAMNRVFATKFPCAG